MKMRVILGILLAMVLLSGCVGCVSADTISSVDITLTTPTTGATPKDATASSSTYSITDTVWKSSNGATLGTSSTFDADTNYTATVTITNRSGHIFANSVTANVKVGGVTKATSTVTPNNNELIIHYLFDKTAKAQPIKSLSVTIAEPLASNTPDTVKTATVSNSKVNITSVTWSPNDKKFERGEKYKVTVVLESTNAKAYPFDIADNLTVYIKGDKSYEATIDRNSNSKITASYTFSETKPKGTVETIALKINEPKIGQNPSTSILSNSMSTIADVTLKWNTQSAFQPDTPYTATFTITAKEGCVIDKNMKATVNGYSDTIVTWENDEKATVQFTFTQITSIDTVDVQVTTPTSGGLASTTFSGVTARPSGVSNAGTVSWSPAPVNGEFESGVEYTAKVTVKTSGSLYVFDKETILTINGYSAANVALSSDYKTITATYTFPKTSFIPNPIEVIKEFFKLMLLMFNPAGWAFT